MKMKHIGGLFALFFIAIFSYIGNKPNVIESPSFPSPDYSKGRPTGYDFNKKDYVYYNGSARDLGVKIQNPKPQEDPTINEMIETYIDNNRDEILDHLQN